MSDVYGFAAAVEELETEIGDKFAWNNVEYPCVAGSRQDGAELGAGGYATSAGIEIVVRRAVLPTVGLTTSDEIYLNGKQLKIVTITHSMGDSVLVLACEDANQDA